MNLQTLFYREILPLKQWFVSGSLVLLSTLSLYSQDYPVQTEPAPDQSNNIHNYLMKEAEKITENAFSGINSRNDWEKIRTQRYNEFIEMMGLENLPLSGERPDLNVRVTGTITMEGYHIEKLYYESLPGLFITANLYVPDYIKEPRPAILYVCGHKDSQKVWYQAHPRKFAQLGFVCLIIETIQYGEVHGEHWGSFANGWFNWYSRGYTPGGVELWNAIRALDLLTGRPEVDQYKIGVTGISGGGAQSWYIAAADPRITAAASVCGASTLKAHILTRTIDNHCDCMMPINTYLRDFQDIGALIAPRPFLIAQSDQDALNTIESVRELYSETKKIYKFYRSPEKLVLIETPGPHAYHNISLEKIFSFFMEHLMGKQIPPEGPGDFDQSPEAQLSTDELRVYVDGAPVNNRITTIQDSFIQLHSAPNISNEKELFSFRDSVKNFLKKRTFGAFPKTPPLLNSRLIYQTQDQSKYSFVSEDGWRLRIDFRWKNEPDPNKPLMIVLRNPGENRKESAKFISELKEDWNIAYFDVRGVGETGWGEDEQWHIRRSSAWTGRTIASMQVYDVLRCLEFCRTLNGVDASKIGLAAKDGMTVIALYSALLDGKCHALILKNPVESQDKPGSPDGRGPSVEMLNCLKITDVYQLPALLFPAKVIFWGDIPASYQWSEEILRKIGKGGFEKLNKL